MQIGDARVSTEYQSLASQHDALRAAGSERIFDDRISRAKAEHPGLHQALEQLRDGDTLIAISGPFGVGKMVMITHLQNQLSAERKKKIIVARSLSVDKPRGALSVLITALFIDIEGIRT